MAKEQPELETKKIKAADAFDLYVDHHPLKYSVDNKFMDDHVIGENLSKRTSIEAAVERYTRNQRILTSSWLMMDKNKLASKAKSSSKRAAHVHNGAQQMVVQLSVTRRTVSIQVLDKKELSRYKYEEVKVGGETRYLNCTSEEKDIKLNVVGPWDPLTGEVELYHYEEGAFDATHDFAAKYLEWTYDPKTKEYIAPTAKR